MLQVSVNGGEWFHVNSVLLEECTEKRLEPVQPACGTTPPGMVALGMRRLYCVLCAPFEDGSGGSLSKSAIQECEPPPPSKHVKPTRPGTPMRLEHMTDSQRKRWQWDQIQAEQMTQHSNYVKGHYYATAALLTASDPMFRASIDGWTLSPYIKGGFNASHLLPMH